MSASVQNTTKQQVAPKVQIDEPYDQKDHPPKDTPWTFGSSPPTSPPSSYSSSEESLDIESSSEYSEHPSGNLLE